MNTPWNSPRGSAVGNAVGVTGQGSAGLLERVDVHTFAISVNEIT